MSDATTHDGVTVSVAWPERPVPQAQERVG